MAAQITKDPLAVELPRILAARKMSLRSLAKKVDVHQSFFSRLLGDKDAEGWRRPTAELAGRIALALELREDYFPEYREGFVIDRIRDDPVLRDQLYQRLRRK